MVWTYFNFSQWLIIWAATCRKKFPGTCARMNGGWGEVGLFLVIFQFAIPFALLLSQAVEEENSHRWFASPHGVILMRIVDIFWHIEPATLKPST